jgi:Ca2+-binding RTX toxin-like protein
MGGLSSAVEAQGLSFNQDLSIWQAGRPGDDVYSGGSGNDTLYGGGGQDTLNGLGGNDSLQGDEGDDLLEGGDGNDSLSGDAGSDLVYGGAGDDYLYAENAAGGDTLYGGDGHDYLDSLGIDAERGNLMFGELGNDTLSSSRDHDTLDGGAGDDYLAAVGLQPVGYGGDGRDSMWGGHGNAQLFGHEGDDVLQAGSGDDRLEGGPGNDSLSGADGYDILVGGDGNDRLAVGYWDVNLLRWWDNAGDLLDGGAGSDSLGGSEGDDSLLGGDGDDLLDGAGGSDELQGGDGHDTLRGWDGTDTLMGGAGDDQIDGYEGADLALGGSGDDTLNGDGNNDVLWGGDGDDQLVGLSDQDELHGEAGDDRLFGGSGDDRLWGDQGDDTLNGGLGQNTLEGGDGDDVYLVDGAHQDQIVEQAGGGIDWVWSQVSMTLPAEVENGRLLGDAESMLGNAGDNLLEGNVGDNRLQGGNGADTLLGGSGYDTLEGGAGDDVYLIDYLPQDLIVEKVGEGIDWVWSTRSAALPAEVENGRLITDGVANLYGNAADNLLVAGDGNNRFYGGAGSDTVSYAYARGAVELSLARSGDQDTGGSGIDYFALIENLTGSAHADRLGGDARSNVLDGGQGADTLEGGEGSDTYVIDSLDDLIIESNADLRSGGSDWVHSSLAVTALGAHLENGLILSSGSAKLFGNAANNVLVAGGGDNRLHGAGGVDTVSYERAAAAVSVDLSISGAQDTGGSGRDTLTLVENLTGSSHGDSLKGNGTWNVLDGGAGADTLEAGAGSDTYVVDDLGDVVIEAADAGSDWVYSRLDSYTLGANVENGAIDIAGTADLSGNALDNVLMSGLGANRIEGGEGSDTVSYQRAIAAVQASLLSGSSTGGSGIDALVSIENLIGSSYDDLLIGNEVANDLRGGSGNDTLRGGDGNDILRGGGNNRGDGAADTFVFDSTPNGNTNYDKIVAFEANGLDKIQLDPAIFSAIGLQLEASEFRVGANALDANDFIVFDRTTGNLFYDADGSGAGAKVLFAKLINWSGSVGAEDFQIGSPPGG